MGLLDTIPKRLGSNALADLNPELLIGIRALKARVFFVNSAAASGGNGASWDSAVTTLQAALNLCAANDVVLVAPGHTENISAAAGIVFAKAGVAVIGLGAGSNRPTFTFITSTSADIDIDAANVTWVNLLFIGDITALAAPIDVNASDFTMVDCETRDLGTDICTDWIVCATADTHRLRIIRHVHRGTASDGGDTWVSVRVAMDGNWFEDVWVDGNFDEGCIENVTAAATNMTVFGTGWCFFRNRGSEDLVITLLSTTTGQIGPNINIRLADDAANITECITISSTCHIYLPINVVNADAQVAMLYNGTASTDAIV